ncbi:MAG: hypothetical protein AB8G05_22265 [Oligoflexales bacterium]
MDEGEIYETTNDEVWEKFNVIPAGDGKYHIKGCHGHYICADQSGEVRVANKPGPWETFSIQRWAKVK